MSLIIIWASPNESGLSAACKARLIKGFKEGGKQAEDVQLHKLHLESCRGCRDGWGNCAQGHCIINDDFELLYRKLSQADAVAFVTPVYWHDISEPLKILLDRMRRCDLRSGGNHLMRGKKGIIIAVAGGTSNGIIHCMYALGYILTQLEMDIRDRLPVTRFSKEYMLDAVQAAARTLCNEL